MAKKVCLCILDGFGLGDKNYEYNAVFKANVPNINRFIAKYPLSFLKSSGISVGLPDGQMGNSEVGHMIIGSGRVPVQDLPMISDSINSGEIWKKSEIQNAISYLKEKGGTFHILGLCSVGGVHSHIFHIVEIANYFAKNGIKVLVHAISDGRDVAQHDFLANLQSLLQNFENGVKIATLCGRYFAMDRDKKMDRTKKAVELITKGIGKHFETLKEAIEVSYSEGKTDEFIEPVVLPDYHGANANDILFFANFRSDRARQVTEMFLESGAFKQIITMMPYSDSLSSKTFHLFEKAEIRNTLSQVVSENNLNQLKIAETEKYAHVTFFFNGGKEEPVNGEDRILIPSLKIATYDLQPEMSLPSLEEKLIAALSTEKYHLVVCNVANGDMVGHTGNFEAAKKAAERIDEFLMKLEKIVLEKDYYLVITADHGNLEEMLDKDGRIYTQHTTGDVPFFIVSKREGICVKNGSLANIAPTILTLMGLEIPNDMVQETLLL